jgi:UDP-N-acetyl-D-glucosamine dehydrogenase
MKIAVIGMGKIGLPLAVQYARKGHEVIGVDINSKTVDLINKGIEPFPEEDNLQEFLIEALIMEKLKATESYQEAVSVADAIVVVVPLLLNEKEAPDFDALDSATENIAKYFKQGALISYETTLPIGTTRNRFTPNLEKISGFKVGRDFAVVFSPERIFTGRIFQDLRKYPKIVGGITEFCAQKGMEFYNKVLDFDLRSDLSRPNGVWIMDSAESAEFVKLAETTYRDVNIGLANQFAMYADSIGVNVYEIIEGANSQNFSHIHKPGISVGGHCIPVYPQFYLSNDKNASIVRSARAVNKQMPSYAIRQIEEKLGTLKNLKVLILGLSYRSKVKESAYSGTFDLISELQSKQADCEIFDPLYSSQELSVMGLKTKSLVVSAYDVLILHTDHVECVNLLNQNDLGNAFLYDGRAAIGENLKISGSEIMTLGRKSGSMVAEPKVLD